MMGEPNFQLMQNIVLIMTIVLVFNLMKVIVIMMDYCGQIAQPVNMAVKREHV